MLFMPSFFCVVILEMAVGIDSQHPIGTNVKVNTLGGLAGPNPPTLLKIKKIKAKSKDQDLGRCPNPLGRHPCLPRPIRYRFVHIWFEISKNLDNG